jgi:phosphatidyl-myo-inositol dimannoside synthase
MNVLALMTDGYGAGGGIAQFNRDFIDALAAHPRVRSIDLLVRHGNTNRTPPTPVRQHVCVGRTRFALAARALKRSRQPGVLICGHINLAPLAALLARRTPWLLITHGIDAWQRPTALKRRAALNATLISAVSRYTRARVLDWSNLPPERVRVLGNTARAPLADAATSDHWRTALNLAPNEKLLLTVGRLDARERYKGHDRVLHALAEKRTVLPRWRYLIVGDGDDRARLEALAQSLGLGAQVQFLGALDDAARNALLALADGFVMPSHGEGFGIVYLEALLAGTPVIGSCYGGAPDPLSGSNHAHAPADGDLAAALEMLLSSPKPAPDAVRGTVDARFGPAVFTTTLHSLIDRIIHV